MEELNYYVKNLETGKLNVFTTKPFYDALEEEQRKVFRQFCLWSRSQGCWVSKGKAERAYYLNARLKEMGFADHGSIGEKLSFREKVDREQDKAAGRAERSERRAENAEQKSDELYNKAKGMASVIPFGQPILVGHHSEKRDRNYRDRIHNTFGKAFNEMDKAEHYRNKAENAKYTAEGKKFSNPSYLSNKIKEVQKNLRILERRLNGKLYRDSPVREISEQDRNFYNKRINEEQEKLDYFVDRMKVIHPDYQLANKSTSTAKKNRNGQMP